MCGGPAPAPRVMKLFSSVDARRQAREQFLQSIGAHHGSEDDPKFLEMAERFELTEEQMIAVKDAFGEYQRALRTFGKVYER